MKKYTLFIVVALMLATLACTKYKDDPFISLRSPEKRLYGYWKIVAFEVDGADSLANLYTYADFSNCTFHFYYDKGSSQSKIDGCINEWNAWYFQKKQFTMSNYFVYPHILRLSNGTINATTSITFEVLKLYESNFWLNYSFYGKNYLLKFKKQ